MRFSPHLRAILLALFVTFLWSTSWVLIKYAQDVPPLTFAGLRYTFAFLILLPLVWQHRGTLRALSGREWGRLAALGLVFYTMTQGGVFVTLKHLEATTFSLLLNFSPALVALMGVVALREAPSGWGWAGVGLFLAGMLFYFYPAFVPAHQLLGLVLAGFTLCANAVASVLGRAVNRQATIPPLVVTVISMGIGALVLLGLGLTAQGLPPLAPLSWAIIGWLALFNTALAFTLWNATLRTLSAVESSIINNTMLIQIAVLAWLFLGERLGWLDIAGLMLATAGALLVQVARPSSVLDRVSEDDGQEVS